MCLWLYPRTLKLQQGQLGMSIAQAPKILNKTP